MRGARLPASALALVVSSCLLLVAGCGSEPPAWNVLLVTFDTTRADHLSPYGHTDAQTPTLDRLAAEGVVFEDAVSAAPITCPSHSTILTGTYPLFHGVRDNGFFVLPEAQTTLAEVLADRGYATGAAVASFPLLARFGTDQGFDFYDDHVTVALEDFQGRRPASGPKLFFDERPAGQVNDALLPWLEERLADDRPFFAWAHYFDPHQPLTPPAPYDQIFAHDLYLGEIAYADESFGRLLAALEDKGALDNTLVILTADHGEGRGQHNETTHALAAYQTTLHVPLILRIPQGRGGVRVAERVGTVDIMPTVLDLLGIEIPSAVQGRSLVSLVTEAEAGRGKGTSRRPYYAETLAPRLMHGWGELRALYLGPLKYIHGPRPELFDLEADPEELSDLVVERSSEAQALESRLRSFVAEHAGDTAGAVSEADNETLQRLAALGYLSSSGEAPDTGPERLREDGAPPQDHVGVITLMSQTKGELFEGNYLEARALAERLIAGEPENPFYLGLLGWSYVNLGQLDAAARILEEVGEPVQHLGPLYLNVGKKTYEAGETERGLSLVQRGVEAAPTAAGYFLLADIYRLEGDLDGYRESLARSRSEDPAYLPARINLAIQLAQDGHQQQAEEELRQGLDVAPLNPRLHFNLGKVLADAGRSAEALRHLTRAAELEPTYWTAHLGRLALLVDLDRRSEAQEVLTLLRRRCPNPEFRRQAEAMWSQG